MSPCTYDSIIILYGRLSYKFQNCITLKTQEPLFGLLNDVNTATPQTMCNDYNGTFESEYFGFHSLNSL